MHITKRTVALFLSSTFIPLSLLVGLIVVGLMKVYNPDSVDITQGLAYLGYAIIPAAVTMLVCILGATGLIISLYRQDGNFANAKLALTMLIVQIVLGVGILLARELNGVAEDNWSRNHNQPTREQRDSRTDAYFNTIKQQKNQ